MTTQWTVVAPASHIALDAHRRGTVTIAVTNTGRSADVAVFGAVAGDGAEQSWFAVAEPQRTVPAGGTVSYPLAIAVPPRAAPGRYAVAGRVYSANLPPEETSRTSGWILFDVPALAAPPPGSAPPRPAPAERGVRLWPIVIAAAVSLAALVLVCGAVIWPRFLAKHEGTIEAEDMEIPVAGTAFAHKRTCCGEASGDAYLLLQAWEAGQSESARFYVPDGDRYRISAIRTTGWNHGFVLLAIDGQQVGEEFDGYRDVEIGFTGWETVGVVELDEGTHELTLTVTDRSAEVGRFHCGLDAIRYESV